MTDKGSHAKYLWKQVLGWNTVTPSTAITSFPAPSAKGGLPVTVLPERQERGTGRGGGVDFYVILSPARQDEILS